MTNKKLRITEEAYEILVSWKKSGESLSECILRIFGKKAGRKN